MKAIRSANAFLIEAGFFDSLASSLNQAASNAWVPAKEAEDFSIGFLPISGDFLRVLGAVVAGTIRIERKKPPRSLLNDIVSRKVSKIRSSGRVVSREEKSAIRSSELKKLIPQALPDYTDIRFFIVKNSDDVSSHDYIIFDRAQGVDVDLCQDFLKSMKAFPASFKAMIPSYFYGNLVEHLLNGQRYIDIYEIGELFEVCSEGKGAYEVGRASLPLVLKEDEFVSSAHLKSQCMGFILKCDGLIKNIEFFEKSQDISTQVKALISNLETINKGNIQCS